MIKLRLFMQIHSINISQGGVPKLPISKAKVTFDGIEGDRVNPAHLKFHGGLTRALCLYSLQEIERLKNNGHPIGIGTTGENLTIDGLEWDQISIGTKLQIGESLEIEITSHAQPCKQIGSSFLNSNFKILSPENGSTRLYARILKEGTITLSDRINILK